MPACSFEFSLLGLPYGMAFCCSWHVSFPRMKRLALATAAETPGSKQSLSCPSARSGGSTVQRGNHLLCERVARHRSRTTNPPQVLGTLDAHQMALAGFSVLNLATGRQLDPLGETFMCLLFLLRHIILKQPIHFPCSGQKEKYTLQAGHGQPVLKKNVKSSPLPSTGSKTPPPAPSKLRATRRRPADYDFGIRSRVIRRPVNMEGRSTLARSSRLAMI